MSEVPLYAGTEQPAIEKAEVGGGEAGGRSERGDAAGGETTQGVKPPEEGARWTSLPNQVLKK